MTIKIDKTGPSANLSVIAGTLGANGWYTSNVTVDTVGADPISGIAACTANQSVTTETSGQVVNGSCTNGAGLATAAAPTIIKLDKTAPSASLSVTAGTPGANGWFTSDLTVHTSGTESVSGPATCTADQQQTTETAGKVFNGSCTNQAGLTGAAPPLTLKLDKTKPDTTVLTGPAPLTNSTSATFTFSGTDNLTAAAGLTFECELDNEDFEACGSPNTDAGPLSEGQHTFQVRAKDAAGNVDPTPATQTWEIDLSGPQTTILSGPANPTSATSATFTFSSSKANSTFECKLDTGAFAVCTSPKTYAGSLADGSHTFQVRAIDSAGNKDPDAASQAWTVDTTPPATAIDSGPSGTVTTSTAAFAFSSPDAGATFECKLDDAPFAPCTSPKTYSGLGGGGHTFLVRATDAAGNTDPTPAARTWTIDAGGPSDPTNVVVRAGDHGAALSWKPPADPDYAGVVIVRTGGRARAGVGETVVYQGTGTAYKDSRLANGVKYTYTVYAVDQAGNRSPGVAKTVTPKRILLASPPDGALLGAPPIFLWVRTAKATYYNVQLYRRGKKILSVWPSKARYTLPTSWTFDGRRYGLAPGRYRWYVWPGLGLRADATYGALLGQSSFVMVAKKTAARASP